MTTTSQSTHPNPARRRTLAAGAIVAAAALIGTSTPAGAAEAPFIDVPAAGAVVTCDSVGPLTGTSGFLRQREATVVDSLGRARVLFTIAARDVRLVGADGARYRLVGSGYDAVLYPTSDPEGPVVHERERFDFDVVGVHGVVGVVRFELRIGESQIPDVHDHSTCQLPNMS